MTDRQLFKEAFSQLHASGDTITEVMKMADRQTEKSMERKKIRRPMRTGALIALAAVLLMGSAFAAVTYHLHTEPIGDLALAVSISAEGDSAGTVAFSGEGADATYTGLEVTANWLPEGMVQNAGETTKWSFEDNYMRGGFTVACFPLNTGNATFCQLNADAEMQENLDLNGHEAIYLRMSISAFNQRLYISYPEFNAVMMIYIGDDVDYDTAVKFAQNLTVSAGDYEMSAQDLEYNGKRYLDVANAIKTGVYVNTADEVGDTPDEIYMRPVDTAVAENMARAHELGESFDVYFGTEYALPVRVVDYAISDNVDILRNADCLDSDFAALLDENGKLPEDTLRFNVTGDGITTPSVTVVAEQTQQPKFVAVTFEVTNNTDETIDDFCYNGSLMVVEETADGWKQYQPVPESGEVNYDDYNGEIRESLETMRYFDVVDTDSNGGNHIRDLAPGESVTVQVAFVVNECDSENLWFSMDGVNSATMGYVPLEP